MIYEKFKIIEVEDVSEGDTIMLECYSDELVKGDRGIVKEMDLDYTSDDEGREEEMINLLV